MPILENTQKTSGIMSNTAISAMTLVLVKMLMRAFIERRMSRSLMISCQVQSLLEQGELLAELIYFVLRDVVIVCLSFHNWLVLSLLEQVKLFAEFVYFVLRDVDIVCLNFHNRMLF